MWRLSAAFEHWLTDRALLCHLELFTSLSPGQGTWLGGLGCSKMATLFKWDTRAPNTDFFDDQFQRRLAHWNHDRLAPRLPDPDWQDRVDSDAEMLRLQG